MTVNAMDEMGCSMIEWRKVRQDFEDDGERGPEYGVIGTEHRAAGLE